MNFKQQMQEKAESDCPNQGDDSHYIDLGCIEQGAFIHGSRAALSSDLVKGLVEALELISGRCTGVEWEGMNADAAIGRIYSVAQTALTNYKQEINYLNKSDE